MTSIRHHIPDDLLMGYAAGVLPQAFDLVVATHVSLSDDARARLASFEEVGGAVLAELEDCEIGEDSLEKTMDKISAMGPTPKPAPVNAVFPKPLRDLVGGDTDAVVSVEAGVPVGDGVGIGGGVVLPRCHWGPFMAGFDREDVEAVAGEL